MQLMHPLVLMLGGLLAAVPIVLHLVMRPRPKHQLFPAIRFLSRRVKVTQRKLQLRHWLLLALRTLAIVLVAAALAQPRVAAQLLGEWLGVGLFALVLVFGLAVIGQKVFERSGWRWRLTGVLVCLALVTAFTVLVRHTLRASSGIVLTDYDSPVAAALVIDTSPRMGYLHQNQTSLGRARELAHRVLRQLPRESQAAVLAGTSAVASFAADLPMAAAVLERLETEPLSRPLTQLVDQALRLLDQAPHPRKELYVFTDLTHASWNAAPDGSFRTAIQRAADVQLYLIDVGISVPRNVSITDARLSQETPAGNRPVTIGVAVRGQNVAESRSVELWLEPVDASPPIVIDGKLHMPERILRGRNTVTVGPDREIEWTRFTLANLTPGIHHGFVRVLGQDGLPIDDQWYFTLWVHQPWPVLVVPAGEAEAEFLTSALAPYEFRETDRARFRCTTIAPQRLLAENLSDYAAIFLLDPEPVDDAVWQRLESFVSQGGGLGIFLGRQAQPVQAFNESAAQRLLPAPLDRQWRDPDGVFLAPENYDHPILDAFREMATAAPWDALPVYRHWGTGPAQENSQVVLRYGNGQPAVWERWVGSGRVLMMTTPISDTDRPDRPAWNLLPTSFTSWPFVVLVDRMALYLAGATETSLNVPVGQVVRLPAPATTASQRYDLMKPDGQWIEIAQQGQTIDVPFTDQPGIYRLRRGSSPDYVRGFAVNLPGEATDLQRVTAEDLERMLGADRFQLVRDEKQIDRGIDEGRIGRELYPWLMLLLTAAFALEHVLSNWFYRRAAVPAASGADHRAAA